MKITLVTLPSAIRPAIATIAIVVPLLTCSLFASAQQVKALIDSQNYVFQARTAQSLHGNIHQLTTDNYTLAITKEKIVSYLPFFGRAYVAPMDPSQTGFDFTSKNFDYTVTPGKKEGWTVLIKPKDFKDVQKIQLTISSAGYTTVQVISTNRDEISFDGVISAPDKR